MSIEDDRRALWLAEFSRFVAEGRGTTTAGLYADDALVEFDKRFKARPMTRGPVARKGKVAK